MSDIAVLVKIVPTLDVEKGKMIHLVQSYFNKFTSFLALDKSTNTPHISSSIEFLPANAIGTNITAKNIIDNYKSNISYDIFLIGVFRQLIDDQNSFTIRSSVLEEGSYVFVNYEPEEILKSDEKGISFIIFNEFINYLFSFTDKHLETHSGPCIRTIALPDDNDFTVLLNSSHYSIENNKFCSNCSEKIISSLCKLGLDSPKMIHKMDQPSPNTEKVVVEDEVKEPPAPTNLVAKATRPPPRKTLQELDPNFNLSFAQRKQISAILKNVGLLIEPLGDSEYLEVRERFFDVKVSEQVFLQILKRKSK